MNKGNKILVGVLAFVVVCFVGYALFSETITVTGTATASGSFDIGFECTEYGVVGNTDATASCEISGQNIITKSELKKPTDNAVYLVTLTNNGTIPAVLKTVNSSNNIANDGDGDLNDGPGDRMYYDSSTMLIGAYYVGNDDWFASDAEVEALNLTLQPGESTTLTIMHWWIDSNETVNGDALQPELPESGASMTYNIELGFEQIKAE